MKIEIPPSARNDVAVDDPPRKRTSENMFLLQVFAFVACVFAVPFLLYLAALFAWVAAAAPHDAPLGGGLFLVFLGLAGLAAGTAVGLVMRQFRSGRRHR